MWKGADVFEVCQAKCNTLGETSTGYACFARFFVKQLT